MKILNFLIKVIKNIIKISILLYFKFIQFLDYYISFWIKHYNSWSQINNMFDEVKKINETLNITQNKTRKN